MGTVYLAEQTKSIRRRVALKLVRAGLGSREILRRFELERQTLSRMEHRGIARVLDAGETGSGQPYFVMELFPGLPITEFCDRHRLGVAARLELFLQVCEAVEHAHRKGIIHRDLKPSNLLAAENADGILELKVIDFGIAKALGEDDCETFALTLSTGFGQILGTPQYMSPEQAASNPPDTRTDVFGLGAVLYEILTGSAPLRRERLCDIAFDEVVRLIREEEPERPSARFDALLQDERIKVSACRGESPESWLRRLKGDLDWIVLRAVEKEPERRYPSVSAFASDLRRYLLDEPVEARPPSRVYRLRKFVRRNRTLTASVATIALVLVAATTISVRWALEAGESRRLAESRLAQADAVPEFLVKAFGRIDPAEGSRDILAAEVIDAAVEEAGKEFSEQPLMRARIFEALARIYLRLGQYGKAEELVAAADDACSLVPSEDAGLRFRLSGILSETRRLQRRMGEAVVLSEGNWRTTLVDLGAGSEEEARARNEWITNLLNAGDLERAEAALDEAKASVERTPGLKAIDFPGLYCTLRWAQGRHDEAYELMKGILAQRAKSYFDSDHDLMWRTRHFSRLLAEMGRQGEAEAWSETLVRCAEQVYGIDHHLATEAVSIRASISALNGSKDAAYFILSLARDEVRNTDGQAPGLERLEEHLSAVKPLAPLAESIDAWFEIKQSGNPKKDAPPNPLNVDPCIFVALSDQQMRLGDSDSARLLAERAYELSRSLLPDGDPRLTVRAARLCDLHLSAGELARAEAIIEAAWTPRALEAPTGRFLIDACDRLVQRLDETKNGTRARSLESKYLFPSLIPLAASMKSGRLSQSYHRIFKDLGDQGRDNERMRLQETISMAVQTSLPASDPFRRMVDIRLCEMLISKGRLPEALTRFKTLQDNSMAEGVAVETAARLDLIVLESKLLRAGGDFAGAGKLLLTGFNDVEASSGSEADLSEETRRLNLRRMANELRVHFETIGDETARLKWAQWDLLENVARDFNDEVRALAEVGDYQGLVEFLENENKVQTVSTENVQKSLRLAEWLADELQARNENGLAARAAMAALRGYRRLGEGSAPVIRQRFLQVQRAQAALPSNEARLAQASEIEEIFSELLGPGHRQTWTMRSHRLVFLHSVGGPSKTRPLIEQYFKAFPDESRDQETLRLWYHNHFAHCLLDLGDMEGAIARLEEAQRFAANLIGKPGIVEAELRRARMMMSSLFVRFHEKRGDNNQAKYWLEHMKDLESGK
jgi:tetratricopeptide (TPR) repeat protein/tRNA A-37 threonylcarbamoyl transferase component Bud32